MPEMLLQHTQTFSWHKKTFVYQNAAKELNKYSCF